MTDRYAEDIREIAGVKDTKGGLAAEKTREQLPGTRGIGYMNSNGSTVGQSGGSNTTRAPDTSGADTKTGDKSALDATNPEQALAGQPPEGSPTDSGGSYGAEALVDKEEGTPGLGATVDSFGDPISNKEYVTEITGVDCTSGDEVGIGLLDDWVPPDAGEDANGVPVPEWENAETPPVLEGYDAAKTWYMDILETCIPQSSQPTEGAATSYVVTAASTWVPCKNPFQSDFEGFAYQSTLDLGANARRITISYTATIGGIPDLPLTASIDITRSDCGSATVIALFGGAQCLAEPPTYDEWPEDNKASYKKNQDGSFETSVYDSDAPPGSQEPSGSVDFCGEQSGDPMSAVAGQNGDTLLYRTDGAGGPMLADSVAVIIDADGSVKGYTDAAGLDTYTLR